MKLTVICSIIIIISSVASVIRADELSAREKLLVKRIIGQSFGMHIFRSEAVNPEWRKQQSSTHPLCIVLSDTKDMEKKLIHILNEKSALSLTAAQALAYLGNNAGINVLEEAMSGNSNYNISSSGIEMSESAICLLYLGYEFPADFKFSELCNPLYPELDLFLKKSNK